VSDDAPPPRVRVTGRSRAAPLTRSVVSEIDAQTELGEVYVRSLVRSQLRLALGVTAAMALTLGLLPLLFAASATARRAAVLGVPVPWWLLGVLVYPFLILLAWFYVVRAERNERAFRDLVVRDR
jgi:hypothetical protein